MFWSRLEESPQRFQRSRVVDGGVTLIEHGLVVPRQTGRRVRTKELGELLRQSRQFLFGAAGEVERPVAIPNGG
jgi:hypothetical protein